MTDVQIKSLKLAAVQRILQAERSVGGSGAAQVLPQDALLLAAGGHVLLEVTALQSRGLCISVKSMLCMSGVRAFKLSSLQMRVKILARLVTQLDTSLKAEVLSHFLSDPRGRLDLALAWLFQEYCEYQSGAGEDGYQECLIGILTGLQERPDQRDGSVLAVVSFMCFPGCLHTVFCQLAGDLERCKELRRVTKVISHLQSRQDQRPNSAFLSVTAAAGALQRSVVPAL